MKSIVYEIFETPFAQGYKDKVAMCDDDNLLYHCYGRGTPNPQTPKEPFKPWYEAYGVVAFGYYTGQCVQHLKHGKCILINNGNAVPALYKNVNHGGDKICTEIFVHTGYSETWSGSAGCLTVPPSVSKYFFDLFDVGEKVDVAIVDLRSKEKIAFVEDKLDRAFKDYFA